MTKALVALSTFALVATACAQSSSYDREWAECEEEAEEELDESETLTLEDRDIRRRELVRECLNEKGLGIEVYELE